MFAVFWEEEGKGIGRGMEKITKKNKVEISTFLMNNNSVKLRDAS